MLAASWSAQLGHVAKGYKPAVGENVATVISELMTSRGLPRLSAPTACRRPTSTAPCTRSRTRRRGPISAKWTSHCIMPGRPAPARSRSSRTPLGGRRARQDELLAPGDQGASSRAGPAGAGVRDHRPNVQPPTWGLGMHQLRHVGATYRTPTPLLLSTTSRRLGSTTRTSPAPRSQPAPCPRACPRISARPHPEWFSCSPSAGPPSPRPGQYHRDQACSAGPLWKSVIPSTSPAIGTTSCRAFTSRPASPRTSPAPGRSHSRSRRPAQTVV